MRKLVLFSLVLSMMFFSSCGGGGGDGAPAPQPEPQPPITLTIEDLAGYYQLEGFYLWDNDGLSLDQDDVSYFWGDMYIYTDYFVDQWIELNGFEIWALGYILQIENDRVQLSSAGQTYWVDIEFDKDEGTLVTSVEPGVVSDIGEKEYWRKISDTPYSTLAHQETMKEDADLQGKAGTAIGDLWNYMP